MLIVLTALMQIHFHGGGISGTTYREVIEHEIWHLQNAVSLYYLHTNEYPSHLEDLRTDPGIRGWRGPYTHRLEDPFGDTYLYENVNGDVVITSLAGGTEGGPITSKGME